MLLAKARLRLALASRDVAKIAAFRHRYQGRPGFEGLVKGARESLPFTSGPLQCRAIKSSSGRFQTLIRSELTLEF